MPDIAVGAIIVAAGSSGRMLGTDKLFAEIAGPWASWRVLSGEELVGFVAEDRQWLGHTFGPSSYGAVQNPGCVPFGARWKAEGFATPRAGLEALGRCDYVAVHDGARPLVTRELIERGIAAACEAAAAVAAVPLADTIKEANSDGTIQCTLDRRRLYAAQTPQVFRYDILLRAHREISDDVTDDAAMLEALGVPVKLFDGDRRNIKVTMAADLGLAEALIAGVVNLN